MAGTRVQWAVNNSAGMGILDSFFAQSASPRGKSTSTTRIAISDNSLEIPSAFSSASPANWICNVFYFYKSSSSHVAGYFAQPWPLNKRIFNISILASALQ